MQMEALTRSHVVGLVKLAFCLTLAQKSLTLEEIRSIEAQRFSREAVRNAIRNKRLAALKVVMTR